MMRLLLGLCLVFLPSVCVGESLRFYGDILLSRGVEKYARTEGTAPIAAAFDRFLRTDGIDIGNLEGAIGEEANCADGNHPCFPVRKEMLQLLSGFDVIGLQNNHSLNTGDKGLHRTIRLLREMDVAPLGGKQPSTVLQTDEGNIAIVAATDMLNSRADASSVIMADSPALTDEIRRLRSTSTVVAVYVHWGKELDPVPTERMRRLAREYVAAGADLVVGTHSHVVGETECIDGRPVAYGLGNFLFDQKYDATKQGAILNCTIADGSLRCSLSSHTTPRNGYLPVPSSDGRLEKQNAALAACTHLVEKTWTGTFTADRKEKTLTLRRKSGGMSAIELRNRLTGRIEVKTAPMPIVKLQPVDLNRDGVSEVMLIQNIYSSFDKETAKRVYLYSLNGSLQALWRGSALSRPLVDAAFLETRKGPILIGLHSGDSFLQRRKNERSRTIMNYRWNGFGFTGLEEFRLATPYERLNIRKGRVVPAF